MSNSHHLSLPYLQASQAQKHVTVNEALQKLDALVQLSALSRGLSSPPESPVAGARYIVASGATGEWAGWENSLAHFEDGAWVKYIPANGWQCWVDDEAFLATHVGGEWRGGSAETILGQTPSGSQIAVHSAEIEHVVVAGTTNVTSLIIPNKAMVLGLTGTIVSALVGPTDWALGVGEDNFRYGNSLGVITSSTVIGMSASPLTYWADTPIVVRANGGSFTSGTIRLSVSYLLLTV
ncbi:MAG: DUF2793 domain-containing protein [Parvibaculaceae bacterium]|nr:DUF2793 domain-containing protein [Parvibaculaceae bacterium]